MMPGGYLEEALYGAYVGTVTVDGPPLSDRDRQRFFESVAAFEETTGIQVNYIGDKEFEARLPVAIEAGTPPDIVDFASRPYGFYRNAMDALSLGNQRPHTSASTPAASDKAPTR